MLIDMKLVSMILKLISQVETFYPMSFLRNLLQRSLGLKCKSPPIVEERDKFKKQIFNIRQTPPMSGRKKKIKKEEKKHPPKKKKKKKKSYTEQYRNN